MANIPHATPTHSFISQRLWRLVIRSVERLGFLQVEQVGVEEFTALLDRLGVSVDDMDSEDEWLLLLLHVVRSPQGRESLSYPYWKLVVELAVNKLWLQSDLIDHKLRQVMPFLEGGGEWDKPECWSGFVWLLRCPSIDRIPEDLKRVTLSLFRRQPGAAERIEKWMQSSNVDDECLKCLQWICDKATSQSHTT